RDRDSRSPGGSISRTPPAGHYLSGVAASRSSTGQTARELAVESVPVASQSGGAVRENSASPVLRIDNDVVLTTDALDILGDDPSQVESPGFTLKDAIASRWTYILRNGIGPEELTALIKKYQVPQNCAMLHPPRVNPEIKAIMSPPNVTRDNSHANYQSLLAGGLSALGQALGSLLGQPDQITKGPLSELADAGKILTTLFNNISNTRRQLVLPLFSKPVKEAIENIPPGDLLFAAEIGEKIREAKSLEKVGRDIRQTQRFHPYAPQKRGRG
ncbi:unnamed protein product, partial [Callosobruchus maculatus]